MGETCGVGKSRVLGCVWLLFRFGGCVKRMMCVRVRQKCGAIGGGTGVVPVRSTCDATYLALRVKAARYSMRSVLCMVYVRKPPACCTSTHFWSACCLQLTGGGGL